MRVLMIAPPGAGKGPSGSRIAAHFGVPAHRHRRPVPSATSPAVQLLGRAVRGYLDRGGPGPGHDLMLDMARRALPSRKAAGAASPGRLPADGRAGLGGIPGRRLESGSPRESRCTCGPTTTKWSGGCSRGPDRAPLRRRRAGHPAAAGPLPRGHRADTRLVRPPRAILLSVDGMRTPTGSPPTSSGRSKRSRPCRPSITAAGLRSPRPRPSEPAGICPRVRPET